MILAAVCTGKGMIQHSLAFFTSERLKICLHEYVTMLWCIAVAAVLTNHRNTMRDDVEQSLATLQPEASLEDRGLVLEDDRRERLPLAQSIDFRHTGPKSYISGWSGKSGTSLSLPINAPCPDEKREAFVREILNQTDLQFQGEG